MAAAVPVEPYCREAFHSNDMLLDDEDTIVCGGRDVLG